MGDVPTPDTVGSGGEDPAEVDLPLLSIKSNSTRAPAESPPDRCD